MKAFLKIHHGELLPIDVIERIMRELDEKTEEAYQRGVISGLQQASPSGNCGEPSGKPGFTLKQLIDFKLTQSLKE